MKIDHYLYEIIEDYKSTDSREEKAAVFHQFCSLLWENGNQRRVYTKAVRFTVRKKLRNTSVGQVFETWSEVEYKWYQSMSKETDWCSLIRQKINNLYTRYFDKEVILKQDYMDLLKTPERLYYSWLGGTEMDADELTSLIDDAMYRAEKLRILYQKQKMDLSWEEYQKVIEGILQKIFQNCKFLEDYEVKTAFTNIYDFMNEDNFYVRYFCTYLENEMKQWQKKYYKVRTHQNYKRCRLCGALIEAAGNNTQYCQSCREQRRLETKRNWWNAHH